MAYANTRFKKSVNEWGRVEEWIEPGQEVSQADLDLSDNDWQALIDSGAVVENYPDALKEDPSTPPAQYYRDNPDEAPAMQVDESTPVEEAKPQIENAPQTGQQRPGAEDAKKAEQEQHGQAKSAAQTTNPVTPPSQAQQPPK